MTSMSASDRTLAVVLDHLITGWRDLDLVMILARMADHLFVCKIN